ncbi:MAG TPA: hypothetical protein PLG73_11590, partial [Candidatus Sumerlaeota bacterium]|nr:hypothetical protein [Candidatus Sumerlaeota bacterium]
KLRAEAAEPKKAKKARPVRAKATDLAGLPPDDEAEVGLDLEEVEDLGDEDLKLEDEEEVPGFDEDDEADFQGASAGDEDEL